MSDAAPVNTLTAANLEKRGYPYKAGHRDADTSIAAAEVINEKLPRLQSEVFGAVVEAGPLGRTGDEIATVLGWDRWRVRPRTSELRKQRKIIDSGLRRSSLSGVSSIVWIDARLENGEPSK